jgi:hypothetical protein
MSALPPKADMVSAETDVWFVPQADLVVFPCPVLKVERAPVGRSPTPSASARRKRFANAL